MPARPSGVPAPNADAVTTFTQATTTCAGARTLTTELLLSGRAGDERLRGRVIAGLERGGAARLEGVAPFGAPIFILAARAESATLLLPRDRRVLRDTAVSTVLERLTGLPLSAADLLQALTGCVGAGAAREGQAWDGGWRGVRTDDERTALMREQAGAWRVVAVDAGEWRADYSGWVNDLPRVVRLRTSDGRVDLTARLDQVEINTGIDPAAFDVAIPEDVEPMTLDELRSMAPLRTP
ncbi:MAG: hypothetical protein IT178_00070 [Acidobacteria bacterium]|nr:hypothetical protein [Acidobacteriota bacterium]